VPKRRKVNNLLALAVLALAVERPMHPYEMAATLRDRSKDQSIEIKWGSLYTVVQNLARHGFLEAVETVREGRRPERTVYRATPAGRAEMEDWLRELIGTPEKEFPRFEAALSLLPGLPPEEVRDLLAQRLRALESGITSQERTLQEALPHVPRLFLIEEEYYLAIQRAEADWVRALLQEIRDGSFPGLDLWRRFHETGEVPPGSGGDERVGGEHVGRHGHAGGDRPGHHPGQPHRHH
jgi:DNA-binding PadR family transcriptional regulator